MFRGRKPRTSFFSPTPSVTSKLVNQLVIPPTIAFPTPAQIAANLVLAAPAIVFNQWRGSILAIWQNPKTTPQAVFDVLGTKAKDAVDASNAIITALATLGLINDPAVQTVLALIKPFTVNSDGTVTVNP